MAKYTPQLLELKQYQRQAVFELRLGIGDDCRVGFSMVRDAAIVCWKDSCSLEVLYQVVGESPFAWDCKTLAHSNLFFRRT
jgi:hypothetical protein